MSSVQAMPLSEPACVVPPTPSISTDFEKRLRTSRAPVYGVAAVFEQVDDQRAHGRDERIAIDRFYEALEFWYRMVKEVSSAG